MKKLKHIMCFFWKKAISLQEVEGMLNKKKYAL